jgi:glycosyltransferase involved in cell wall biosynthesis
MIRVLHLITTLQSGGAQAMLTNLVTARSSGCSLAHAIIEMTAHDTCDGRIQRAGVPLHTLGMRRGRISLAAVGRFVQLLRRERPSIVQTWLYHADLLGLVALPVLRVPLVWNVRCSWHVNINGLVPRACARLSKLPTAVVVNSQAGQAVHQRLGYRPRRWCLIGNGFDLNAFKPDAAAYCQVRAALGLRPGTILIGIVGRWDPNKDYATFLAAAGILSSRRDDVQFVMVGEGLVPTNEALDQLIMRCKLQGRVHLVGRRTDVNRLTAALDIAACTSVGEGFPNVVGEAMAAGVPCVTTDVGDARQLVGDAALVVPRRDPEALATTWLKLLAMDPSALHSLGLAGRARIAQHYDLSSVIKQYESLYEELSPAGQSIVRASP